MALTKNFLKLILKNHIYLICTGVCLFNCLTVTKYPEKPKPIINAEKIGVCFSYSDGTQSLDTNLAHYLNENYFSKEDRTERQKYKIHLIENQKDDSSTILFALSVLSLGIIPSYSFNVTEYNFHLSTLDKKREDTFKLAINSKTYFWLPFLPVTIYDLLGKMDLTGVKDYSEIAYQKLKVIKDITEKENKEEEEKQKIFVENLFKKIQNNIPKKELYNLDYYACTKEPKNCQKETDFDMSYFNNKENEIVNSTKYKGDQFAFNTDKPKFKEIRDKRFLLINTNLNLHIEFLDYDFTRKGYNFKFSVIEAVGRGTMNIAKGYRYPAIISENYFLKMSEADAKEFQKKYKQTLILAEVKNSPIDKHDFFECTGDGKDLGRLTFYASKEDYKNELINEPEFFCKPISKKIKKVSIEIKKVIFYNEDNTDMFEG